MGRARARLVGGRDEPGGAVDGSPVGSGMSKACSVRGWRDAAGRDAQSYGFRDQQRINAGLGWRFSLSAFGDLKTASARHRQAMIAARQQRLAEVRTLVAAHLTL